MNLLLHDFRSAIRGFRRTPAFTTTAVLIVGIGIGMAVAMFTVFRAVLLRRLPVRAQEEIVVLWTHRGNPSSEVSGDFKHLHGQVRPELRTLQAIAGVVHWGAVPAPFVDGDVSVTLNRTMVTGNYFDVLGAHAVLGRLLRPDDDNAGDSLVNTRRWHGAMVISYGAWRRQFGGDPSVIGRRLVDAYQQVPYTIVGVAPPGLDYPAGVEAWTPPWSTLLSAYVVARLAPNATPAAARAEFFAIENRLLPEWQLVGATATPFSRAVLGDVRAVVGILTAAVGLLLVIACVNVGNLLLLRAASRTREIAIRRALGASYGDIARQLVVESAGLGLAGGILGFLCAEILLRLLVAFAPPRLPALDAVRVAGMPLGAAIGVTMLATVLFGVLPALSAASSSLASPLRLDSRSGTETRVRRRVRQTLVASQIALALVLLMGAGLLVRSLEQLVHLDLGYRTEHLAIVSFSWPTAKYNSYPKVNSLGAQLLERLRGIPGIRAITPIAIPPFLGANVIHGLPTLEGQSPADAGRNPSIPLEVGNADFFRTLGIPILQGRGMLDSDREDTPQVAVVSAAVARRLWPNQNPLGKRMRYWTGEDTTAWRTVVGVAGDIRFRSLREATPTIYVPWRQGLWQFSYGVRTSGELASVLPAIRREAHALDAGLDPWQARSMDEYLAGPLTEPRLSAFLLSGFGIVALMLAALGLYGVMASAVRDQAREIGVRMALGATPARVRREVLGRAMVMTALGAGAGLAAALAGSRVLRSLLFEVSPTDPTTLAAAAIVLVTVAFAAAYLPARRATKIDPVEALRAE